MEDKLIEILEMLVAIVQNTAPKVWEIAIRQAIVQSVGLWIGFALCLAGFTVTFNLMNKYIKKYRRFEVDSLDIAGHIIFLSLTALIGSIFLYEALARIINPEYYAIQIIFEMIP